MIRALADRRWLLLAAAALTVTVSAATAAEFHCPPDGCEPRLTGADPARLGQAGVYLGQVIIALFAASAIGGEYGNGMIRLTLTAVPRRLTAFAAMALVVTAAAITAGALAVGGSVLAGVLILPGRGLSAANGYLA